MQHLTESEAIRYLNKQSASARKNRLNEAAPGHVDNRKWDLQIREEDHEAVALAHQISKLMREFLSRVDRYDLVPKRGKHSSNPIEDMLFYCSKMLNIPVQEKQGEMLKKIKELLHVPEEEDYDEDEKYGDYDYYDYEEYKAPEPEPDVDKEMEDARRFVQRENDRKKWNQDRIAKAREEGRIY